MRQQNSDDDRLQDRNGHNEGHRILLPYIYLPFPFWKIRPQLTSHDCFASSLIVHPFNKMMLILRLSSLALGDHTIQ